MTRIALIGTAGRREDGPRMSYALWLAMVERARAFVRGLPEPRDGVSGGAAWADHCAVELFLRGELGSLVLHLPAAFDARRLRFAEGPTEGDPGRIANHYHRLFSAHLREGGRRPSFHDLAEAATRGARLEVHGGFKERNAAVARCDAMLAQTFGLGAAPKRVARTGFRYGGGQLRPAGPHPVALSVSRGGPA